MGSPPACQYLQEAVPLPGTTLQQEQTIIITNSQMTKSFSMTHKPLFSLTKIFNHTHIHQYTDPHIHTAENTAFSNMESIKILETIINLWKGGKREKWLTHNKCTPDINCNHSNPQHFKKGWNKKIRNSGKFRNIPGRAAFYYPDALWWFLCSCAYMKRSSSCGVVWWLAYTGDLYYMWGC